MAATFTLNSHSYDGRYLQLTCSQTPNSTSNSSTISWTLTVKGGNDNYYSTGPTTVKINGTTVYSKSRTSWDSLAFPAGPPNSSTSGTLTVKHNSDGAKSVACSIATSIYDTTTQTKSGTWVLNGITRNATITSFPSTFTDEDNPVLRYSNVSGSTVTKIEACMRHFQTAEILVPYRTLSKTGTSYTFNLTSTERANLRKVAPDGWSSGLVLVYLTTTIGSETYHEFVRATLNIVNGNPTLVPTAETDATTQTLTGSADKVIKSISDVTVNAEYAAIKGASLKSFGVTHNGKTISAIPHTFTDVENGTFKFTVTDNRGNTTTQTIKKEIVDYVKLTCAIDAAPPSTDGTTELFVKGNYFNSTFGAVANTLTVQFRVRRNDEEYGDWITLYPIIDGNTYSARHRVDGLDYRSSYTYQARAIDKISEVESVEKRIKTTPVFDWGEYDFNFNVPVSFEGNTMADFVIETGTEAMGTNGTWYWRKWKSGRADCYGLRNYGNMAITTAWGSLFMSEVFTQSLPSGLFASAPQHIDIAVNRAGSDSGWIIGSSTQAPTASATGAFRVCRAISATASQLYISFNVIGRWK